MKLRLFIVFACACSFVLNVIGQSDLREDIFEEGAPTVNGITIPMVEDNFLKELIGDDRVTLHTYMGLFYGNDDNVSLDEDDANASTYLTELYGGRIGFEIPETLTLQVDSYYKTKEYFNVDNNEKMNDYFLKGAIGYTPTDSLELNFAAGTHKQTTYIDDLLGLSNVETITNTYSTGLTLDITEKVYTTLQWDTQYVNYAEVGNTILQYRKNTGTAGMYYRVSAKTNVGLEVISGRVSYESVNGNSRKTADFTDYGISTSTTCNKLSLNTFAGFTDWNFGSGNLTEDDNDVKRFIGTADLTYTISDHFSTLLSVEHGPRLSNSGDSNFYIYDRVGLTFVYIPVVQLQLTSTIYHEEIDKASSTNDYDYDKDAINLAATYSLTEYTGIGASYEYSQKHADTQNSDYDRNMFTVGMWMSF
ncbi:MAG: hypothetical protein U9O87_09090 [Verrucomicrobiota bacterium]|nr:hypothetical protein [Verrucomicrobiota bacterium]